MRAWLQSLAPRERMIVAGGGVVLLAVVLYLAVIEPVARAHADLDAVAFDRLVQVLSRLRAREGLRVERAVFERVSPGQVDASIDLERPQ